MKASNSMAKTNKSEAPSTKDAPKRKMPTQAERVARLEAELAAARAKAEAKETKAKDKLRERRDLLNARITKLRAEVEAIDSQLGDNQQAEQPAPEGTES